MLNFRFNIYKCISELESAMILILLLLGMGVSDICAQQVHHPKPKSKMYTGKRAWWLDYQFFPALEKIDVTDDTVPDLQQRTSFFIGGGYAGLRMKDCVVDYKMKWGGQLGFRYTYLPSRWCGFRTGLDFSYAQCEGSMDKFNDYYYHVDEEFDDMRYNYSFDGLEESYSLYVFDIPVQLVGQLGQHWSAGLGLKLALPIVSYKQTISDVVTSAYYPQYDNYVDDAWVIGCGSYPLLKDKDRYTKCQLMVLATADVEYQFKINDKLGLGVGLYCDYSITGLGVNARHLADSKTIESSIISITDKVPVDMEGKSVLSGKSDDETKNVIEKVKYFNAGLKVSININKYGPAKPRTKPY